MDSSNLEKVLGNWAMYRAELPEGISWSQVQYWVEDQLPRASGRILPYMETDTHVHVDNPVVYIELGVEGELTAQEVMDKYQGIIN